MTQLTAPAPRVLTLALHMLRTSPHRFHTFHPLDTCPIGVDVREWAAAQRWAVEQAARDKA